jgi:hypothetical protein
LLEQGSVFPGLATEDRVQQAAHVNRRSWAARVQGLPDSIAALHELGSQPTIALRASLVGELAANEPRLLEVGEGGFRLAEAGGERRSVRLLVGKGHREPTFRDRIEDRVAGLGGCELRGEPANDLSVQVLGADVRA